MAKSLIHIDPFKSLRRWDPFTELREIQRDMERLYDRFLGKEILVSDIGYGEWLLRWKAT